MSDPLKRLRTPHEVVLYRSKYLASSELSQGIIVDVACGGGTPLIEACRITGKRGIGIELDAERAALAQEEVRTSGLPIEVLCGDGTDVSLITNENVAVLMYDPERPMSGGSSHFDGLQPPIEDVIMAWTPRLSEGAAFLFDLPPRFSKEDQQRVENLIEIHLGAWPTCWSVLSRGASRIDRLMLHAGPTAGTYNRRCIRLLPNGEACELIGSAEESPGEDERPIAIGDILGLIDATVPVARLWTAWSSNHLIDGWLVQAGRRPTVRFEQWPVAPDPFLIDGGTVVTILPKEPLNESMEAILSACHRHNLAGALLRAKVPSDSHSKFQRMLDATRVKGERDAIIIDLPNADNPHLALLDRSRSATLD
ncbi:MAG TPA: class I SAM-dependent methyltransferase [Candidatus Poseidoniales archaeon]|nr:class I SAM-dependent methyltransferase [Candidatus Poseidoniales archaeon]